LKVEPARGLDCSGDFKAAPDIRISTGRQQVAGYVLREGQKVKVRGTGAIWPEAKSDVPDSPILPVQSSGTSSAAEGT